MAQYEIVLADDHPIFRIGVRSVVEEAHGLKIVGEAADGLELLQLLRQTSPHLVILDLSMRNAGGLAVIREMKRSYPQIKVLILTMHRTRAYLYQAISLQVQGYLLKEDTHSELIAAIKVIQSGGTYYSALLAKLVAEIQTEKSHNQLAFQQDHLTQRNNIKAKLGRKKSELVNSLFSMAALSWPLRNRKIN